MSLEQEQLISTTGSHAQVWPATVARPVMPVYSVEARLRLRRIRRVAAGALQFLLDAAMINAAFIGAYYLRFEILKGVQFTNGFTPVPFDQFQVLEIFVTVSILLAFTLKGLYRLRPSASWFKQAATVTSATTLAFTLFFGYDYIVANTDIAVDSRARSVVIFAWVSIIVLVSLARLVVTGILKVVFARGVGLTSLLVVGSGRLGKLVMQQIAAAPTLGFRVAGFIHDGDDAPADFGRFQVLGTMADLDGVIRGHRIAEVIIALPSHQHQRILRTVRLCERAGADFRLVPDLYELSISRIGVDAVEGIPLIHLRRSLTSGWQRGLKRALDITVAGSILVIGSPFWVAIALAIKLDSAGPVLYKQPRTGFRGEIFSFLKFRSMHVNSDQMIAQLREQHGDRIFKDRQDPRRTRVGRFIRRTSLDEIPQLINVLRGDMSLIGPRPLPVYESANFEEWERARLEVPPGITGLWQVRGRSDITFDEMVLMDLYYVENWSLRLDLQILMQTIPAVIFSRGAY
jgi:exopolysaccharide biosynthesis polyprenyl glycosylphosphotransferase